MRIFSQLQSSCLVFLLLASPAFAIDTSFDCREATEPVEKLICQDEDLAELDVKVAEILFEQGEELDNDQRLIQTAYQSAWLEQRNACGQEKDTASIKKCVTLKHLERIRELEEQAESAESPERLGPFVFRCEDKAELIVNFFATKPAVVHIREQELVWLLPQVEAASGARYAKGDNSFWNKGTEATYRREGRETLCKTQGS